MDAITDQVLQDQATGLMFTFASKAISSHGLKVRSFTVTDRVSELYAVEIDLVSGRHDLDIRQMTGTPATLTVHDRYSKPRHFHGLVELIERGDTGNFRTFYRVRLMPTLHLARYRSNCRIFQNQTIKQITDTLLKETGVIHYAIRFQENHPVREYCVQYRETDLEFLMRLWAEEGAHFHHEHSESGHKLIIDDTSMHADDVPETPALEYNAAAGGEVKGPAIRKFRWTEQVQPRRVVLRDHSFLNPKYGFEQRYDAIDTHGTPNTLEMYDYPGRHKDDATGKAHAKYRLEYYRTQAGYGEGTGRGQHLMAGRMLRMAEHPVADSNRRYFLTAVTQRGTQPTALEDEVLDAADPAITGKPEGAVITTGFHCIQSTTPFRPHQLVKPMVDGPQMGIVVGPASEVIHTDQHSRVKVQFPWDRYGKSDDGSSCWIRVSMATGGGQWGHVSIPRVGHHVIVSFLEGDPDQPIITGRAFHAVNRTPYQLPQHKTKTVVLRSDTHKGVGFNEMSVEDQAGQENMFMHAQKDHTIKVRNNHTQRVDASAVQSVGANQALEVGSNMSHQVGGGMSMVVGAVGGAASSLITPALQGLMGQSSGMLGQAMSIAQKAAMSAASSALSNAASTAMGGASGIASGLAGAAAPGAVSMLSTALGQASPGTGSAASSGLGQTASGVIGAVMGTAQAAASTGAASPSANPQGSSPSAPAPASGAASSPLASAATGAAGALASAAGSGLASAAGGGATAGLADIASHGAALASGNLGLPSGDTFDSARSGINDATPQTQQSTGGASMSTAMTSLAQSVGGMIGGGILNQLIGKVHNTTVGVAQTEQVGATKILTVGQVYMESIGHVRRISVGDEFAVEVGAKPEIKDKEGKVVQKAQPPKSLFLMKSDGTILIKGVNLYIDGEDHIQHWSKVVDSN